MKKVLAALVMVLGTGSSVVFAQEVNNSSAIVAEAQVPQDEFVKIDPTELPQAVMQTLAKDYEGASVKEAYVKETEETTLYKIIIVTQDGQEAETLLNEKGENLYLSSGRILYKLNDSANQLFELTSYPARATERDGQVRQAGEEAYIAELDDLSRDEAEQTALKLMESLIQSEICRAEVVSLYGYTGKQLKRIHQTLYRERDVWRYFYRELPSEVENGLYYVEMRLNIGGIPVCIEEDARGINGSVDSSDSIFLLRHVLYYLKKDLFFWISLMHLI